MDEKTKAQLDQMFKQAEHADAAAQQRAAAEQAQHQHFLDGFWGKADKELIPAFNDLGEYLKGRGFETDLLDNREGKGQYSKSIVFSFGQKDERPRVDMAKIEIIPGTKMVKVRTTVPTSPQHTREETDHGFNQVSAELIKIKAVVMVRQLLETR